MGETFKAYLHISCYQENKAKPTADTIAPWCKAVLQRLFLVWGSVFAFQKDLPWYSSCSHLSQYVFFFLNNLSFKVRRSNQSILKKINPEYSLEGLMLKLQYFGHLITYCWERLKAKGEEGSRRWFGWIASLTQDMNLGKLWETVKDREAWHAVVHGVAKRRTPLSNWTTTGFKDLTDTQILWKILYNGCSV